MGPDRQNKLQESFCCSRGNSKSQAPAFAEAASRRQAKSQTNPNDENPKFQTKRFRSLDILAWNLFDIWKLEFVIYKDGLF
jgi:hypothetical protein